MQPNHHRKRVKRLDSVGADHVAVLSWDLRQFASTRHTHEQAQLIYAISGVVSVATADGTWVVPPSRAVWVPAGIEHESKSHGAVQFRVLMIDETDVSLPRSCMVVEVTALLREMTLRLAALGDAPKDAGFRATLTRLLLLELSFLPVEPLRLPVPQRADLARFCDGLQNDPARAVSLEEASEALHMSRSTFMRLFHRETGLSFAHWRKQARLLHALSLLAEGKSILDAALACGYDSPSAFSAMFRRSLGRPPSEYFASSAAGQSLALKNLS